jgi:hypothetical protein
VHHGLSLLVEHTGSQLRLVNLHPITLSFLLLLQQFVLALALDINTAVIRELVLIHSILDLDLALGALDTFHLSVLVSSLFAIDANLRSQVLFLLSEFVCTVLLLVSDEISLGLLGGELGRSRSLVVPRPKKSATKLSQAGRKRSATYHFIANRVTRGFSARTLRRIFSMMGLAGGSLTSSSLSYSLLT